jgi:hypothetical protein
MECALTDLLLTCHSPCGVLAFKNPLLVAHPHLSGVYLDSLTLDLALAMLLEFNEPQSTGVPLHLISMAAFSLSGLALCVSFSHHPNKWFACCAPHHLPQLSCGSDDGFLQYCSVNAFI